jgi:hypothetical protein
MVVKKAHNEYQFLDEPNCYGKESLMIVNLFPVRNKSEIKYGIWEICG